MNPRPATRDAHTRRRLLAAGGASVLGAMGVRAAHARTVELKPRDLGERAPVKVVKLAGGLQNPWSLAFLPDGAMLITERPGRLRLLTPQGQLSKPVEGVPAVHARGQGGLLDVALSPQFERDRTVFLSYAMPGKDGARTAVARAMFAADGRSLRDVQTIFRQRDGASCNNHFGCRIVPARDGNLFVTLGDRWDHRNDAQTLNNHFGKIVRIRPDGSVPPDNPFANRQDALPEIYSFGHRNIQGAALHPATGLLWIHEHGAQGGDEINIVRPGANYGWPVITYSRNYGIGTKIGEGTERADVAPPLLQWTPSIAPSGMAFVQGDRYPGWNQSLLVGSLKFRLLVRLAMNGERPSAEERLLGSLGERIRDVRQGPDGLIYLLTDADDGQLLRLDPES